MMARLGSAGGTPTSSEECCVQMKAELRRQEHELAEIEQQRNAEAAAAAAAQAEAAAAAEAQPEGPPQRKGPNSGKGMQLPSEAHDVTQSPHTGDHP